MDRERRGLARLAGRVLAAVPAPWAPVVPAALGVFGFVARAGEMREGRLRAFDDGVLRLLLRPHEPPVPIGSRWMVEAARN